LVLEASKGRGRKGCGGGTGWYDMSSGYWGSREAEKTVITEGMILNDGAERIWYDSGTVKTRYKDTEIVPKN
jgi:hypothetical protein